VPERLVLLEEAQHDRVPLKNARHAAPLDGEVDHLGDQYLARSRAGSLGFRGSHGRLQPGQDDLGDGEDDLVLYRNAVAGWETKTIVVYDEPFWRADGYSGQTAEPGSAAEVTLDASPSSGSPGVIAAFTFGPVAQRLESMGAGERRKAVLEALAARLGPHAASPAELIETSWWTEEWSRGCSMAHFTLGTLTRYGHLLREPFGHVHWAGTETATVSHGAIDGAVRSGERVAAEILDRAQVPADIIAWGS